ncbi:MAG TPA: anaerobic ribonucleoside-triphosphate reductase [Candidatus Rifleibacterium sp.]|nr:anaerobic ribonucleoside-triphosphate reductase [Candidatus Rifleibacterium sp.]HPT45902.1 anaerobic ribonucleoside-triphosphate reductase [Candidatus Rifleibacterium sp.]
MVIPEKFVSQFVDNGWLPRQRCEVWSRVMGYYRPVSQWNVGKKAEYAERHQLDLAKDISYPVGEETFAIEPDEEPAPYNP